METSAKTPATTVTTDTPPAPEPTVIIVKTKRKKYTKGLKDYQKRGDNMTKYVSKITDAVADGMKKYQKERGKSAEKRKDGAIVDFFPNAASGLGKALREASKGTKYLGKVLGSKRRRKYTRRVLKNFARIRIY